MGGGARIKYPGHVWTPFGGWYNNRPAGWRFATGVSTVVICAVGAALFYYDTRIVRYSHLPARPTVYQSMAAYREIDDPDYKEKVEQWNKEKGSFWSRITPQK